MTSEYFDASASHLTSGSRARVTDINTALDAIDTGLAKLPTEAQFKRWIINYAADTGAADAIVVTLPHVPTGYTDGMQIVFKAAATNTGATTINVNALGVKSVRRQDGSALVAGDITAGSLISARYNATSGYVEISAGLISTAGTMGLQNASAVNITAGTIGGTDVATIATTVDTVGEAEAKAGTATTRRFWTAQRVKQAQTWTIITANTTAVLGGRYICDTSAGAFTLTLPLAPTAGDYVWVMDPDGSFVTNNLTVGRNGSPIMGLAEDLTVDEAEAVFMLVYHDATNGWRLG